MPTAFIVGAGHGLGRGLAASLVERGFTLAVADIDAQAVDMAAGDLSARPGLQMDVTDECSVEEGFRAATERLGRLDLVVNAAGVLSVSEVIDLDLAEWRRVMEVNATGAFLVARQAARHLTAHDGPASIVTIASIGGKVGDAGIAHYCASKFAVLGLTQSLAKELARHDITVNAICPGVVQTSMIDELGAGWDKTVDEMIASQAIPRPQTPDDIAEAITYLHRSRSVTGQAINVDGGTVFH